MNAVASDLLPAPRKNATSPRRALAMVSACAPPAVRALSCAAAALIAAFAILIAAVARRPERGAMVATVFIAIAIMVPWGFWFSRLLLLRMEARASRIPALAGDVPMAMALLLFATVLLPAASLVVLAGSAPVVILSGLVLAAMAALLLAMLPRWCYLAVCFAPLAWILVASVARRVLGAGAMRLDLASFEPSQLPWLATLAALLAAWRWRAIVRGGGASLSPWRQPVVLAPQASPWGGLRTMDANQWQAHMPDWLWPAGQTGRAGPARPLDAVRAILGTPFAPLNRRQMLVQGGFGLLVLLILAGMAFGDADPEVMRGLVSGGLVGGLAGGGMVLVGMYGWRLDVLRRRPAGEMAELALLPGLGRDPAQARRTLLRAVAKPLLQTAVFALLLLMALSIATGTGGVGLAWLLVAAIGLCLLAMLGCLRPLSGQSMLPWWMFGLLLAAMVMLIATTLVLARPQWTGATGWLGAGWVVVYVGCGIGLATAARRFRGRPHPFVQE
jgi:hypothetical protein